MTEYTTVKLKYKLQQQSAFVVNGVPQGGQQVKVYYASCGHCNRVLAQFNPEDSFVNIANYCKAKLATEFKYCPSCGYRLGYTMDVLDATTEVSTEV